MKKKKKLVKKNYCPDCNIPGSSSQKVHPSFLKCEKCGKLILNPNYDHSFIGG